MTSHTSPAYRMPVLILLIGFVVCPVSFVASQASAADSIFDDIDYGRISIGGRAAYIDPKDGDGQWFGGAQVRLHLSKIFAIEGSADYRQNKFGSTTTDTFPVQVSALAYLLPGKRLSPFVLGGGGWYYTHVNGPNGFDNTQNRFGFHAGGGLQWFISRHWSIDGTYRYIWLEKIESKDQNVTDKSFQDNGHMITAGINFHF
jgi:opacity protein-like surface antigen